MYLRSFVFKSYQIISYGNRKLCPLVDLEKFDETTLSECPR